MKPYSQFQAVVLWLLVFSLLIHSPRSWAQTVYVSVTGTNSNSATATSWANALSGTALQGALATAPTGTTFLVAAGAYKPTTSTDRAVSFVIPNGVQVYGGYSGSGSPGPRTSNPSSSTLSGEINNLSTTTDNSYHVVQTTNASAQTRLDGFVVTGGNANAGFYPGYEGGGLLNTNGSPTLLNCDFVQNTALNGGGVSNFSSSPSLTNCRFSANTASQTGGGLFNHDNSQPGLTNCSFLGNSASQGGAIAVGGQNAGGQLINCTLSANSASGQGGGIHDLGFNNTTQFTNCVFWDNGGANTFTTANGSGTFRVQYSLLDATATGYANVTGNLTTSQIPFVSATNLQLRAGSPAFDAGYSTAYVTSNGPPIDLAGQPRLVGCRIDMGAFEYQDAPGSPIVITAQPLSSTSVEAGTNVTAFVSVTGTVTGYQWYKNNVLLSGQTSATLTLTNVQLTDAGSYSVVIRNAVCSSTSTAFILSVTQSIRYVKQGGTGNGGSWAMASGDLQGMINADGVKQVWVAAGTYKPTTTTNRNASFSMKNDVIIYGGFPASGTPGLSVRNPVSFSTILSGDIDNDGTQAQNSYHVINNANLTETSRIDGFMITGGNADGTQMGGGVLNVNSSGQFFNCIFINNASAAGGAMYHNGNATPRLANCVFQNNQATNGGAIYTNGRIILTNSIFFNNSASVQGGAIFNSASQDSTVLYNSVVFGNGSTNTFANTNGAKITVYSSIVQQGTTNFTDGGNTILTPTSPFVSTTNLRLRLSSEGINAGSPNSQTVTGGLVATTDVPQTDLIGQPRIAFGRIDIGVYEYQGGSCNAVVYVSQNEAGDGSGSNWANAIGGQGLRGALATACSSTTLLVASGLYKPTSTNARELSFAIPSGVQVYGGYAGSGSPGPRTSYPSSSTLSGEIGDANIATVDNSYHVVEMTNVNAKTRLDGFVITGGQSVQGVDYEGGGLRNVGFQGSSNPTLANLYFIGNLAAFGGALCNDAGAGATSSPVLTNVTFSQNTASNGGAMGNYGHNNGTSNPVLTNVSFSQNRAYSYGGAMYNQGDSSGTSSPMLTNVSFSQNTAYYNGGAIYNYGGDGTSSPVLTSVSFSQNTATYGGAVYNDGHSSATSNPTLTSVSFSQNTAYYGGAMYNDGNYGTSNPVLTNVSFSQNIAYSYGGAMYNDGQAGTSSPVLASVTLSQNTAIGGGAIYNDGHNSGTSNPTLTSVSFSQNTATYGGAVYNDGEGGTSSPVLTSVTLSQNTATYGGAVYNDGSGGTSSTSSPSLTSVNFSGNTADYGGAMYNDGEGGTSSPVLTNVSFSQNTATYGGALYNYGQSTGTSNPSLTSVNFVQNTAAYGGALYNDGQNGISSPTLINVSFSQNTARENGGAMVNNGANGVSKPTLTNVSFSQNTASYGGALYNDGQNSTSQPVLTNVSFSQNTATTGGAMYNYGSQPDMTNSVVFGNGGSNTFVNDMSLGPTIRYCLLESTVTGYTPGPGTLLTTTSPFASTATTQLAPGSRAINTGNNGTYAAVNGPATDLGGSARIQGGTIDMGAFELAPDLITLLYTLPSTVYGTTPVTLVIEVTELNAVTTGGLTTVHLSKDALLSLSLNPALSVVGGRQVQNSQWSLDSSNPDFYLLTTTQPVVGGRRLSVGLSGELRPGRTKGSLTISGTVGNSLGESSLSNNTDSDKVDYFQK